MTMPRQPLRSRSVSTARASAAPSSGSVPPPGSSMSTRDFSVAPSKISFRWATCDENVERFSSMDWLSPTSHQTLSKTASRVPSAAGTNSPHAAIRQNSPHILSVTVLPPVLAPLINRMRYSPPTESVTGTAFLASRSG